MIRLAFLITGLDRGGAELQVAQLAAELRRREWDVAVFSLRGGALEAEVGARSLRSLPAFRPHILNAHLFHANIAARLARLWLPVPAVISTVHSLAETSRGSDRIRYRDFAYRLTNRLSDATVFVSQAAANRHRAPRSRVIPNGVDTDRFRPDAARRAGARAALGLRSEFAWLAAGRLMWKKNYPLLLDAMSRQPEAVLLIAGEGPDEAQLRATSPPNVRFLGARSDMPDLMNAADAFVLSSAVEGLPMVLLEAAVSGLPCVATSVGGVPEAVADGQTGYLVPPGDPAALSSAMQRVAREDCRAMSRAARQYAVERFDLHRVVTQWEELYRELLHEKA